MEPRRVRTTRDGRRPALAAIAILLLLAAIAIVTWVVWLSDDDEAGPEAGVTLEDVADDRFTDELIGQQVTISGEVSAQLVPGRTFWIGGGLGGEDVLVAAGEASAGLDDGATVQVTGTVADFETLDLAGELGLDEDDLGPEFGPYEEQNVIRDASVTVLDSEE